MRLKCYKCGHEWDYGGKMTKYASCPDCHSSIKIDEARVSE